MTSRRGAETPNRCTHGSNENSTVPGCAPPPLAPTRKHAKAKVVTHEEAREAAGPMDAEVVRWLELREQWVDQPHPGRTYCR